MLKECNNFIEDAELGLLAWNPAKGDVLAVHKSCNAKAGDPYECTAELGTMLIYLLQNTGIQGNLRKWQDIAESLSSVGS